MTDYLTTKLTAHAQNKCVRVGCERKPGDAHLLCDECAEDHRGRNRKAMKRTRAWRRLQMTLWEVLRGH